MARSLTGTIAFLAGVAPTCAWMATQLQPQVAVQQHLAPRQVSPAMVAVSRRKAAIDEQVDEEKLYEPMEAVALMKKLAGAKFIETAELHGNLNLDPKYNDQQIRTTVSLPHGSGKSVRVAVSADRPASRRARASSPAVADARATPRQPRLSAAHGSAAVERASLSLPPC